MATRKLIEQLKTGILEECQQDLVSFLWADWIAIEDVGIPSLSERRDAIVDAVLELVSTNRVEVGDAVDIGGFVEHRPWPEQGDDLRERLRRATTEIIKPGPGDGFWLARVQKGR